MKKKEPKKMDWAEIMDSQSLSVNNKKILKENVELFSSQISKDYSKNLSYFLLPLVKRKSVKTKSIEEILEELDNNLNIPKTEIRKIPEKIKNKPIPLLLSGLPEVPEIKKEYLQKAPNRIRTRIFREGLSKQRKQLGVQLNK